MLQNIVEWVGREPRIKTEKIAEEVAHQIGLECGWTNDEYEETKKEMEELLKPINKFKR